MQTHPLFEQLNGASGRAIAANFETMLDGVSELRHLQLDAIQKAQRRTMQLAKTLGTTADPKQLAATLQSYAQENLQEAVQYWDNYRRIVQDTKLHLLSPGDEEAKSPKAAGRKKR
jgi:hypothetical protein